MKKNFASTTRVIPQKLKIIEKKFAIYFCSVVARVSKSHFPESIVNIGCVEGGIKFALKSHAGHIFAASNGTTECSSHPISKADEISPPCIKTASGSDSLSANIKRG